MGPIATKVDGNCLYDCISKGLSHWESRAGCRAYNLNVIFIPCVEKENTIYILWSYKKQSNSDNMKKDNVGNDFANQQCWAKYLTKVNKSCKIGQDQGTLISALS